MSREELLGVIEGYDESLKDIAKAASEGTDYTGQRFVVKHKIAALHPKRLNLKVVEVITETDSTKTFRLRSTERKLPPFLAGQYINLFVEIDGVQTARPYAISSSPSDRDHYDVTIKRITNGYVSDYFLDNLEVDMVLESTGPMGTFYHNPIFHGDDLIFLAGGSGVAPAMSMIDDIMDNDGPRRFHLVYGSRFEDDIIFRDELAALEKANDFLTITHVLSEPKSEYAGRTGFIDVALIKDLFGDHLDGKMFYVCGPSAMYDFCLPELEKAGVAKNRIKVEANGPPKFPQKLEGWPSGVAAEDEVTVTVKGAGSFTAKAGEPLLNSLERNGYGAENACRSGECSLCRVKILSGEVFNPPEAHLRVSDRKFGWCHSCVAFPTSDVEILL